MRKKAELISVILAFLLLIPVLGAQASANKEQILANEKTKYNLAYTVNYLMASGMTIEAALGFAANINAESTFNPEAVNSSSGAYGMVQWLGGRKSKLLLTYPNSFKEIKSQAEYLVYELESTSQMFYNHSIVAGLGLTSFADYEQLKSSKDAEAVTGQVLIAFERPCSSVEGCKPHLTQRLGLLEQTAGAYIEIQKETAFLQGVVSDVMRDMESVGRTPETPLSTPTPGASENPNQYLKEEDLHGLSPRFNFGNALDIEEATADGLTAGERYAISQIREQQTTNTLGDMFRIGSIALGYLMIIYSLVLLVVYMFDRNNTLIHIELYKMATFGKKSLSRGEEDTRSEAVTIAGALKISGLIFAVGTMVVSGLAYRLIVQLINLFQ